ncbi:hypothetical protein LCGC14_1306720 [marine sediment metagenome]|uniref:Uncharacterized protein n=1 Tax=marine sediment metagenome TaxID=412755 RepID=A0A0F9N4Q0_9ZZZZ
MNNKTSELLCRLTAGVPVRDQWRTPDRTNTVIAMVDVDGQQMRRRAELLAGSPGNSQGTERLYRVDGLEVAVSDSGFGHAFVAVSIPRTDAAQR